MLDSTLIFVDGENLAIRYKEMVKAGRTPAKDNIVIDDCFVWNHRLLSDHNWNLKRISYYTSIVGDDEKVSELRRTISRTVFRVTTNMISPTLGQSATGQMVPFVRKKSTKSRKEGICDIAIAVDVMRACYRDHAQCIWLFSGDADFIQLFQEIVHSGKKAYASAFSSGLCPEIPLVVDEFLDLDNYFFDETPLPTEVSVTNPELAQAPNP
jgi:uncharacterized LabA/DUF88 family protein